MHRSRCMFGSMPDRTAALPTAYDHNEASLEDVHALYDAMHEAGCPVLHSDALGGFYLLASHPEVRTAAADWQTFSSAQGIALPKLARRAAAIEYDPPEHGFWRDLYKEVLNLATYREFEDRVTAHTVALIDSFAPRGHADLFLELAIVIPVTTIMEIIGVHDPARIALARDIGHAVVRNEGPEAIIRFILFCQEEVEARRAEPRADFITRLAVEEVEPGRLLTDDEIGGVLVGFFTAGHHTTASVLASLLDEIARDEALRDRLVADPSLIPKATEEAIRLHTPLHGFFRTTTTDTEVAGTEIPADCPVMLNYAAANRDPNVFETPHEFRLDRKPNPHVGFGYGIHTCVGAQLGRLEVRIVIEQLLKRLPDIVHTGEEIPTTWEFGNGEMLERVPVTFTPPPA
jgi:cytochrome P450